MRTLIYDFETSGLNPFHEDVIEIGCKCVETGEFYQCYVKPLSRQAISEDITKITGITNDILKKDGLNPTIAYKQFMDFIKDNYDVDNDIILIAHNGTIFDDILMLISSVTVLITSKLFILISIGIGGIIICPAFQNCRIYSTEF